MKKADGSLLVIIGSTCQYVPKQFLLWSLLNITKECMSLATPWVAVQFAALSAAVFRCPFCRQRTGPEFLIQLNTLFFFSTYITITAWHQDSVHHALLGLSD